MRMGETADIIVVGGGIGGCMAALAAAKAGRKVVLTEETDWLGGQLTSQAVPPDEHPWIESFGCTRSYREFRERVRRYYRDHYPLTGEARGNPALNPGNGWVSRLCHEPRVALRVLEDMMAHYVSSGQIAIMYHCRPVGVRMNGEFAESVDVRCEKTGRILTLQGRYYIDATECGDVLPLAGVEYVTGAEARSETGEPYAPPTADPLDIQPITHVFAVDCIEGGDFTIERPEQYEFWRSFVPGYSRDPLFGWKIPNASKTDEMRTISFMPDGIDPMPLWTYRRIIDASLFEPGFYRSDITLINWSHNDYLLGPIYDVPETERQTHLEGARQLSLSLVYWLQTEAPRPDGGRGYPGIRLRGDVLGTADGLAKRPYIRESRRIKAVRTVTEHDVSRELRGSEGIRRYEDSVGVGSYHLDVHPTVRTNRTFYIPSVPYEIPLGALLPIRVENVLPGCKNIGTTQVANGCYRLHPAEWNIGEAVGYLAAYAVQHGVTPRAVRDSPEHLRSYLNLIRAAGIETHWPEDLKF
jgi:hypothetical protein